MSLKALFYAYVLGGLTFLPLVILAAIFYTIYTSVPIGDPDADKLKRKELEARSEGESDEPPSTTAAPSPSDVNDLPKTRKGWLTVRRTFEETPGDASYVGMVRGFLDARSKDPKRSRPKDMWYVALKGKVLYLYEDESMTECEAAIELSGHDVVVYPEGLPDGELFAKRNAICLKPKVSAAEKEMPSVTREMKLEEEDIDALVEEKGGNARQKQRERERLMELEKKKEEAREQALDISTPWFIFVRSAVEMEDWYLALVHASDHPPNTSTLDPLKPVFKPDDMSHLVSTLDEQPDVIPMRWLNALLGRIFFSYYKTQTLESYIIGRLMKKISRVKRPGFLTDIVVREVSVGNRTPTFSKPMLKELTKEGDASLEVHLAYKGEVRITVEATATINLGARFKTYTVKLVLALVLREIEGNLLVKVKRPPSSRIWYAFTQMPRIVMDVEPVVSDRQITWGMILSTIESKVKEVIQESVVLPNMDDIAFFESSQYQHRGGIWADASRRERTPSAPPTETPPADGTKTPASAPPIEPPKLDAQELPALQRSRSADVEKSTESSSPPNAAPIARAATTDVASAATLSTSPATRRRSWFPGVQEESDVPVSTSSQASDIDEGESRGRSQGPDVTAGRRSSSTPNATHSQDSQDGPSGDDTGEEGQYLTPTPSHRRSSSQHSRSASSRAASFSSHAGDVSDDGSEPQMATYRSKSPAPSGSSPRQTPSSPSSFLQTLKSRAGDKQALSNTAKEAMRKWGVNWSNFRRDNNAAPSLPSAPPAEEVPDAGHGDQRRIDTRTQFGRPSYAEVRAAVAERRERDRAPLGEASSRSNTPASEPIPVPQGDKAKETLQPESTSPAQSRLVASSPSTGTDEGGPPRSVSPAALPVERSESQVSTSSRESASQILGIAPEEPERPPLPIHTQPPPPKTMTIPGIHASHRGEVMSMGYIAPPPAPQESKKAPLQSVYRLWKNPGAANSTRSEPAPVSQTGFSGRDQDQAPSAPTPPPGSEDRDSAPSASSPPVPPARPVPPPLPPRANSTHVLISKSEIPRPAEVDSNVRSPASAALQSIVSKDRVKRASFSPPSSPGQNGVVDRSDTSTPDRPDMLEREDPEVTDSPLSLTPVPSSPPTPPAQAAIGRGPPPALPPRRVRTSA
ncbi:hypothetical protein PYCCODRAFT_1384235 [Trametes coccinea BRFM310]|uniref:SMP-LTD domain-containing protein n=1 Tax=Trametes coccinea (strain BRFM310) TaxID=1353009 RepID=A0A1Y2IYB9_TRAC3|nr:hypothetical protein PYCCODRAFT_1384235 [Trametes coccinea BRFM310]